MVAVPSITVDGYGLRLTQLVANSRTLPFAATDMLEVQVHQVSDLAVISSEYQTSGPMTDAGSSIPGDGTFNLDLYSSGGSTYYRCGVLGAPITIDGVDGYKLTPKFAMGSALQPTHALKLIALRIRIPAPGPVANCRILIPSVSGYTIAWSQVPTTEIPYRKGVPGFSQPGRAIPGSSQVINVSDQPSGDAVEDSPAFFGAFYGWDDSPAAYGSKPGFLICFDNLIAQGYTLSVWRDAATNELTFTARWLPANSDLGSGGASDMNPAGWGMMIFPWFGDRFDGADLWARIMGALSHPGFVNDPIDDRVDYPQRAADADAYVFLGGLDREDQWVADGNSLPHPLGSLDPTEFFKGNLDGLASYLEVPASRLLAVCYSLGTGTLGEHCPVIPAARAGVAAALSATFAAGYTLLGYAYDSHPSEADLDVGWGVTSKVSEDRFGDPIQFELAEHHINLVTPLLDSSVDVDQYVDAWIGSYVSAFGVVLNGFYLDTLFQGGTPNANAAAAADRGVGSTTWLTRMSYLSSAHRSKCASNGFSEAILMYEHPNEHFISKGDIFLEESVGVTPGELIYPSMAWAAYLFGTRVRLSCVRGPQPPFADAAYLAVSGYASSAESCAAYSGFYHALFYMMPILANGYIRNEQFIDLDDPTFQANEFYWRFLKNLVFTKRSALQHYRTKPRLRPLPSSQLHRHLNAFVNDPDDETQLHVAGNKLQISFPIHDEDSADDTIYFGVWNWSDPDGHPETLNLGDTMTEEGWAALGSSPRDVYALEVGTNRRVTLPQYDGGGSYVFDLDVGPGEVWMIEMPLAGATTLPTSQGTVFLIGSSAAVREAFERHGWTTELGDLVVWDQDGSLIASAAAGDHIVCLDRAYASGVAAALPGALAAAGTALQSINGFFAPGGGKASHTVRAF